jgi:hypothetical protein
VCGAEARDETNEVVAREIAKLRERGLSLREIVDALNGDGQTPATGKPWHAMAVTRVLAA